MLQSYETQANLFSSINVEDFKGKFKLVSSKKRKPFSDSIHHFIIIVFAL